MKTIIFLIAIFILAMPPGFHAPDPPAQGPAGPMVELSLIVTDKNGKYIDKISKDEIRIIEDRVEQPVLSVERDSRPIDYGLLIDSSASLRTLIASTVEAARLIIVNRRVADEIFIQTFISSDKINTLHEFSTDTNALLESLKLIRIEGGQSAVIDALYLGARHVAEHNKTKANRRKVLVIITDGEDRNSQYQSSVLITSLRKEGIQVFALGLVVELDNESGFIRRSPRQRAEQLLNTVTGETGGRVFYPKTLAQLINASAEIITDLRSQFRVTYQSSHSGKEGFRKVDIELISPSGERRNVTAPRGYFVDPQSKTKDQKSP